MRRAEVVLDGAAVGARRAEGEGERAGGFYRERIGAAIEAAVGAGQRDEGFGMKVAVWETLVCL